MKVFLLVLAVSSFASASYAQNTALQTCNTIVGSGGSEVKTFQVLLEPGHGDFSISFEAYAIPDAIHVDCEGKTLLDKTVVGYIEANYTLPATSKKTAVCNVTVTGNPDKALCGIFSLAVRSRQKSNLNRQA